MQAWPLHKMNHCLWVKLSREDTMEDTVVAQIHQGMHEEIQESRKGKAEDL